MSFTHDTTNEKMDELQIPYGDDDDDADDPASGHNSANQVSKMFDG